MKLLLLDHIKKLEAQYKFGAEMKDQKVIVKLFDPLGSWSWYLMNIDPNNHNYVWGIVKGFEVEMGSIEIRELEKIGATRLLGIERDINFEPMPALEVWEKLQKGIHI